MTYRVTFMERTDVAGNPSEAPPIYVEVQAAEGVILDKTLVERAEPSALHSEERLEEDDSFLSVGSETWDYEIADGREKEFLEALKNSQMALECIPLDWLRDLHSVKTKSMGFRRSTHVKMNLGVFVAREAYEPDLASLPRCLKRLHGAVQCDPESDSSRSKPAQG